MLENCSSTTWGIIFNELKGGLSLLMWRWTSSLYDYPYWEPSNPAAVPALGGKSNWSISFLFEFPSTTFFFPFLVYSKAVFALSIVARFILFPFRLSWVSSPKTALISASYSRSLKDSARVVAVWILFSVKNFFAWVWVSEIERT